MIRAEFFRENSFLLGFRVSGHSGYAASGKDIVCAASSSATQMVMNTITEIKKIDATVQTDEKKAEIYFYLKDKNEKEFCNILLQGLKLQLSLLEEAYSHYIHLEITEV
jgi:uncharacterized protein YsxB (DUF464 family)